MISREEANRRIKRIAQMRNMFLEVRRAVDEAYKRGEHPYPPSYDVRSDVDYWIALRDRKSSEE